MNKSPSTYEDSLLDRNGPTDALRIRKNELNSERRSLILDAARTAFFELGLKTSLREIAKRAGYTPAALYSYFSGLEEIYAALLIESLQRLYQIVDEAGVVSPPKLKPVGAASLLRAKAQALYDFYSRNPRELDLGLYLFNGVKCRGLNQELDKHLNEQLRASLRPFQNQLEALGKTNAEAVIETTAVFAHIMGILVLTHTGRIRVFEQRPETLFERYMNSLIERVSGARV